jgi:hypothetical protein
MNLLNLLRKNHSRHSEPTTFLHSQGQSRPASSPPKTAARFRTSATCAAWRDRVTRGVGRSYPTVNKVPLIQTLPSPCGPVATFSPDIVSGDWPRRRDRRGSGTHAIVAKSEAKSKPVCVAGQAIVENTGSMQPTIIQSELLFGTFRTLRRS